MPLVACHWPRAKQTRRPRRYAQATTRSKTTQHIIHDMGYIKFRDQRCHKCFLSREIYGGATKGVTKTPMKNYPTQIFRLVLSYYCLFSLWRNKYDDDDNDDDEMYASCSSSSRDHHWCPICSPPLKLNSLSELTVVTLCALLRHDLFATAKFLVVKLKFNRLINE